VGRIGIALVVVVVAFSLFTHLAPLTGRQLFIVGGGSMEPTIPLGSLVISTPTDTGRIRVGDVVTIRGQGGVVITHRVTRLVDTAAGRFVELKGDANRSPDAALVPVSAVVGVSDQYLPFAGYAESFLSTVTGIVSALAMLGALLLAYLLLEMLERPAGATTVPETMSVADPSVPTRDPAT
jgi:signal peptidase